ncbi:MAG: general secretion pathway protein N [Alteromonadaceae bacterium]|jgi:general secretion pathway protein N
MKKWFIYGAMFVGVYLSFVIATIPAHWVIGQIKLPKGLVIESINGSIWSSTITQLTYIAPNQRPYTINNVNVSLNSLSVLLLNPSADVTFGYALAKGPEGSLTISGLTDSLTLKNVDILLAANDIAQQLTLPMPIEAHDYIKINVASFVVGKPICQSLEGLISWQKASVSALDEKVKLGALKASLSCEEGALALTIDPLNDMGLSFTAYVRQNSQVSGNGFLKPADKFPEQLTGLLPFLGDKDSKGRYRLAF